MKRRGLVEEAPCEGRRIKSAKGSELRPEMEEKIRALVKAHDPEVD